MAKAKDQVAPVAATEPVSVPAVATVEKAPETVGYAPPAAPVAPVAPAAPVEPALKEFVCDFPAGDRPPGISVERTVKAKDAFHAMDVYFKTLGIIETHIRPTIVEKVAGK